MMALWLHESYHGNISTREFCANPAFLHSHEVHVYYYDVAVPYYHTTTHLLAWVTQHAGERLRQRNQASWQVALVPIAMEPCMDCHVVALGQSKLNLQQSLGN